MLGSSKSKVLWQWAATTRLYEARWLPAPVRRALAGEQHVLATRLTPAACVDRLHPVVSTSPPPPWRLRPLAGSLSKEGFILQSFTRSGAFTPVVDTPGS